MPSRNPSKYMFMYKVYGIQKGIIPRHTTSAKIKKAAKKIHPDSVKEFLIKPSQNLSDDIRYEIISVLKEIREPMSLQEQEQSINPIAKTFTKKGDFDQIVNSYRGVQLATKEKQAVHNFMETKPSKMDNFNIVYNTTDDFGNNTDTTIKKLKDANTGNFVWTAITKYSNTNKQEEPESEEPPAGITPPTSPPEQPQPVQEQDMETTAPPGEDELVFTISAPFKDDAQGSEIIGSFLKELDL